jgi:hypothetical protein
MTDDTIQDSLDSSYIGSITAAMMANSKPITPPTIDHLPDAVIKDPMGRLTLLAGPGDKLVIERVASILAHKPWLDTKTYTVESVEESTGIVHLWDEDLYRNSSTNYITGIASGYRFKLATAKGAKIGQRKRGRPRKNPETPTTPAPTNTTPKKRGRPKGAKNRPKDVIKTEKAAKTKHRKEKAAKRKSTKHKAQ